MRKQGMLSSIKYVATISLLPTVLYLCFGFISDFHVTGCRRRWESCILASLEQREDKKTSYTILRSDQLVGTALIVLVKTDMVPEIRSVEATTKKVDANPLAFRKETNPC